MVAKSAQHIAPNNVAICCVGMLRSLGWGFTGGLEDGIWEDPGNKFNHVVGVFFFPGNHGLQRARPGF